MAELIGNEPFEEEILATTLDARRPLLKPGGRLIPHTLELMARPLLIPDADATQRAIGRRAVERWRQLYAIDFQPLLDAALPGPVNNPTEAEVPTGWPPLGPPVTLARVELGRYERPTVDAILDLPIGSTAEVNVIAVTFRAQLHGTIVHALDPWTWPCSIQRGARRGGTATSLKGGCQAASRGHESLNHPGDPRPATHKPRPSSGMLQPSA